MLLTAACARKLKDRMQWTKDMHMGSTIKLKWLQDWSDIIKGGYLVPPIGGYYSHRSSTHRDGRLLKSHLESKWAQPGTRPRPDHPKDKHRHVCVFLGKGKAKAVTGPLMLPEMHEKATWITEAPPGTEEAAFGKPPRNQEHAARIQLIGNYAIRQMATACVTDPEMMPWRDRSEHHNRAKRAHIGLYCRRIFASPGCHHDVPWQRPQALGIKPPHERSKTEVFQGWIPPKLHYPNDTMDAYAVKACGTTSKAPSRGAKRSTTQICTEELCDGQREVRPKMSEHAQPFARKDTHTKRERPS